MNKKGIELSLTELVRITVMVIILISFFYVTYMIYTAFYGDHMKDERVSLDSLGDQIDIMLARNITFTSTTMILPGTATYAIRGYGASSAKPELCKDKPCICLTDIGKDGKIKPLYCRTFKKDQNLVFVSPSTDDKIENPGYPEPISQYGYSDLFILLRKMGEDYYVEKFVSGDKKIIFVSLVGNISGLGYEPLSSRSKYLSTCSNESSMECIGLLANSKTGSGFCKYSQGKCTYFEAPVCGEDKATSDCVCGNSLLPAGLYCIKTDKGYIQASVNCKEKIKNCYDYCLIDDSKELCTLMEERLCTQNICKLEGGCTMKNERDAGVISGIKNYLRSFVSEGYLATISGTDASQFIRICTTP